MPKPMVVSMIVIRLWHDLFEELAFFPMGMGLYAGCLCRSE